MSQLKKLLIVTEDQKQKVRNIYGKTEQSIKEDIEIIKEWMKKQPHLPEITDDFRIENFLLRNKFNIEKTKVKIDKYFTMKNLYANFFENQDVTSDSMRETSKTIINETMPKLTENLERLMIVYVDIPGGHFDVFQMILYLMMKEEIGLSHDYFFGERVIFDFGNLALKDFMKIDPSQLFKALKLHQEGYSSKLIGLEFLNAPPFLDLLLQMLKTIMKPKLFNRITIHQSLDSLHQKVSPKCLPKELGGEMGSIKNIREDWIKELEIQKDFLLEMAGHRSNEKLRVGETCENTMFGVDGCFKKLNLD